MWAVFVPDGLPHGHCIWFNGALLMAVAVGARIWIANHPTRSVAQLLHDAEHVREG